MESIVGVLIGILIGIVALARATSAHVKIHRLNRVIDDLSSQLRAEKEATARQRRATPVSQQDASERTTTEQEPEELNFSFSQPGQGREGDAAEHFGPPLAGEFPGFNPLNFVEQFKARWMVWLGGLCISLAGVFLVKYSIDQGYLGPLARVTLGLVTGIVLHIAAEWWRSRNSERYGSIAALAGGASITLFAALLAALHLYHLWPPIVVFVCLAAVSIATMWLALLHGPILAILGILGAYLVPVLVDTGSQNINGALLYSLIISASAFLLMRWVYRSWLWWGTMAGGLFWFSIAVLQNQAGSWVAIYLTVFGYLMLALQGGDFLLQTATARAAGARFFRGKDISFLTDHRSLSLLILIAAQCYVMISNPDWPAGIMQWLPLAVLVLVASRHNQNHEILPWLALLGYAAAIIVAVSQQSNAWTREAFQDANQPAFMLLLLAIALTFSAFSYWNRKKVASANLNASLTWLAPVVCMAVIYLCQKEIRGDLSWGLGVLLLGAIYAVVAAQEMQKGRKGQNTAWLIIATHAAYSMAATIMFSQASLTLALALQVVSLVWISQRFALSHIDYVIKAVVAVVVMRLTLNPWLFTYPDEVHWSLWTYGGSFAAVATGAWLCTSKTNLRPWLEGAAIHLLILFLNTELRYWFYDGQVFAYQYSFNEAAINTNLWAAMAMIYLRRSYVAFSARKVYEIAAYVLMFMAVLNFVRLLTLGNPLFGHQVVSSRPIWNGLLVAYGLPVLMWLVSSRYFVENFRKGFQLFAVFSFWFFVSVEIRHLWQGGENLRLTMPVSDGELYSYSLAWLLIGVAAFVFGIVRQHKNSYQAGLALLGLVIAKIFILDMADLQGILRVLSFMGLGLCLLGLAFLHQYLERHREAGGEKAAGEP